MKNTAFLFLVAAFLLAQCSSAKKQAEIAPPPGAAAYSGPAAMNWSKQEQLMPLLEEAQKANKPVMLEFYATWCGPCKIMEREVFTDPRVYQYFNQNYLTLRVDVESKNGRPIAEVYDITGMPTVVFVDTKGVELERELGLIDGKRLRKTAQKALEHMK